MKPTKKKQEDEMRAEYDFSKAERGKFYRPLDKGYTVHVTKKDGTVEVNHYILVITHKSPFARSCTADAGGSPTAA